LRGEVLREVSANDTIVTMRASDTTPDNAELGGLSVTLSSLGVGVGTVDVSNTLTEIESSLSSTLNTINGEEVAIGALEAVSASEAEEGTLNVETSGLGGSDLLGDLLSGGAHLERGKEGGRGR
jgi:hypothetical protein